MMKKITFFIIAQCTLLCTPINLFAGNCTSSRKVAASNSNDQPFRPELDTYQQSERSYKAYFNENEESISYIILKEFANKKNEVIETPEAPNQQTN